MINAFENYLRQYAELNEDDISRISAPAITRKLRRNEFLLREGEICRHKVFVVNGLLRTFGATTDGAEHILQFSPEHTWTLDVESYDNQTPSKINICAVEPTEVLLWNKPDFDGLRNDLPQLQAFSQQLISRNIYNSRHRLLTTLSATPEERYEDFVLNQPQLLQRLPLRMVASYLGISLKTLNRVRQSQLQRT